MPYYDYACLECDKDYTFERSIKDEEPHYVCDTCGYGLSRIYNNIGITFKGSGFYKTDNRKK